MTGMEYRRVLHELPQLASFGVRIFGFSATTCGLLNATVKELGLSSWNLDIMEQPLEIRSNVQLRVEVVPGRLTSRAMDLANRMVETWKEIGKGGVLWFATCTVDETNQLHERFSQAFPNCAVLRMVGGDKEEATRTIKAVRERDSSDVVLLTTTSCAIQGIDLDVEFLVMLNTYSPVDVFQFAHRGGRRGGQAHFILLFDIIAMRRASRDDIVRRSHQFCDRFAPCDTAQALNACTQVGVIRLVAAHVCEGVCLRVALLQAMGAGSSEAMKCPANARCSVCAKVPNFRDLSIAKLVEIAPPNSEATTTTTTTTTTPMMTARIPSMSPHQLALETRKRRLLENRKTLELYAQSKKTPQGDVVCFACDEKAGGLHFGQCQPKSEKVVAFQGTKWHSSYAGHKNACGYCGHKYDNNVQPLGSLGIMVCHSSKTENINKLLWHASKEEAILAYNEKYGCAIHVHHERRPIVTMDECLMSHAAGQCNEALKLNVRGVLLRIFFMEELRRKVELASFGLKMSRFSGFGAFFEHALREGDVSSKVNLCEQLVVWWVEGCCFRF